MVGMAWGPFWPRLAGGGDGGAELVGADGRPTHGGTSPGVFAEHHDVADGQAAVPGQAVAQGPGVLGTRDVELFEDDFQRAGHDGAGGCLVEDFQVELGGLVEPGWCVGVEAEKVVVALVEVNGGGDVGHGVFSVLCGEWCAGQRWGSGQSGEGGRSTPKSPRRTQQGFRPARAGAKRLGRACIGPKRSLGLRSSARAWVDRSGPRPIRLRTLLTAKRSEGLRISATAGGQSGGRMGRAAAPTTGRKKKGG